MNPQDLPDPLHGEVAALIIADDQYLLRYRDHDQQVFKFLSPAAVRIAFNHEPIDSGWLPAGVRRWGVTPTGHFAVLNIPRAKHQLLFDHDPKVFDSDASVVPLTVPLPTLVFAGLGLNHYLWALASNPFQPNATLYHAPLPNVHPDGQVCWGVNTPPNVEHIAQAWQLFCAVPFSEHLCSGKSKAYPNDVRLRLRDLAQRKRLYPVRDLVVTNWTLEQAVAQLLRRTL